MRVTSDYSVYESLHRAVNRVLDSPFYATFEPVVGGTRVTWRWEVEPQNALVGLLLPALRPLFVRFAQRELESYAKRTTNKT